MQYSEKLFWKDAYTCISVAQQVTLILEESNRFLY